MSRGEPLIGTASRVSSWLLVEQPGAWGPDALTNSDLDPAVGRALLASGRVAGVRVLLIRRPGRVRSGRRQCFLAHTGTRSSWLESFDVDDPAELVSLDLTRAQAPEPPGICRRQDRPICLVCTHGRHDACCADLGRPVVRALTATGLDDVWETSHVGGDRFAGNLVSLPDGSYFGRVQPEEAPALVADLRQGVLRLDRYRGRSCHPPIVQAAELATRQATGVADLDGVWLERAERAGEDRVHATFGRRDGTPVAVEVVRRSEIGAKLTCAALRATPLWSYHAEGIEAPGVMPIDGAHTDRVGPAER